MYGTVDIAPAVIVHHLQAPIIDDEHLRPILTTKTHKYMNLKKTVPAVAAFSGLLLAAASCSTPKDIAYFQDVTHGEMIQPLERNDIKVRPEDKLSIVVSTQDPALSSMFNLVQTQNRLGTNSGTTTIGSTANSTSDGRTSLYTVDADGDINFPVLGRLHVAGMNRTQRRGQESRTCRV